MKQLIIYTFLILSLTSCGQTRPLKPNENLERLNSFKTFINKFKVLTIPFVAETNCYEPDSSICFPLDMDNDSIFIDYVGPAITIGLFPDTSIFYAVLYCQAASCYMPTLVVFSKDGKRLSKEEISNGCSPSPGYRCSDSLTINSMTDIEQKLNEETFKLDENGNEMPGTSRAELLISHFSIDKSGQITKKVEKYQLPTRTK